MLASIRRLQKGILIVVTAIIIIAFAWLYDSSSYDQLGQTDAFSVNGRTYRVSEAQKLMRSFDICRQLGTYDFLMAMAGRQAQDRTNFAINLLVLRARAQELGIKPSDEQISEFIKELPIFRPNGNYDPQALGDFTTNILAPNGFSAVDLYQLAGDAISYSKIQELLGANIIPSPGVVDEAFQVRYTEISAARIDLPKKVDSPPAEITDVAIKEHYEQNKAQFMSDPKRRIEYVLFEKPEAAEGEIEEVTKTKMKVYGETVAEFAREVLAEGADFAALAKKHGATLVKTEAFSFNDPPAGLKDISESVSAVFRSNLNIPISDPINTPRGYALFNLLAVSEPQPLDLAAATPEIRERLKIAADISARQSAAAAARAALAAELAAGKPLTEAVTVSGLTAVDIPAFSRDQPPSTQPDAAVLSTAAADLNKGELSDVLNGATGPFLVYLKEKKPLTGETVEARRNDIIEGVSRLDTMLLFESWFNRAREISNVQFPAQVAAQ